MPTSWFLTAFGPTQEGKIIQRNERAFRQYVSDLCGNDLEVFHERFDEPIESWFFLKFPPERLTDRKYQLSSSPLIEAFYAFKQTLPLEDQIYVSCNASYLRYLKLAQLGGADSHLTVRSNLPEWEAYVRGFLHPQFIRVDASQKEAWVAYLESKYGVVVHLNKLYATDYSTFDSVVMPENKMTASVQLSDFCNLFRTQTSVNWGPYPWTLQSSAGRRIWKINTVLLVPQPQRMSAITNLFRRCICRKSKRILSM
jgi:hypothetical protein